MVKLHRRSGFVISLVLMLLVLAACGDTPSATPAPTTAAAAPATAAGAGSTQAATTQPATAAQSGSATDLLAQLKARGVVRVANTQASPPWSLLNDKNQPEGYDVDVANELAKRMGIGKVEFVASDFKSFILGLQSDKFDMVIAGLSVTEERKQQVEFSAPYEVNGVAIFVSNSNDAIKTQADLAGKKVAVSAGSTQETYAREKIPNVEVKTYENATLALSDVAIGRADAALFSRYVGAYLASKNNLKVKPTQELLNVEVNAMAVKKGQTALKAEMDKALASMIADGTLTTISKKWLGGLDMAVELQKQPK